MRHGRGFPIQPSVLNQADYSAAAASTFTYITKRRKKWIPQVRGIPSGDYPNYWIRYRDGNKWGAYKSRKLEIFETAAGAPVSIALGTVSVHWTPQAPTTTIDTTLPTVPIHWTPQSLTTDISTALPTVPIHWTPQTLSTGLSLAITPESIHWTPQTVTISVGAALSPVSVHWTPQTFTTDMSLSLPTVSVEWVPQTVTTGLSIAVSPVNVHWTTQTLTTSLDVTLGTVSIDWVPQTLTVTGVVPSVPGAELTAQITVHAVMGGVRSHVAMGSSVNYARMEEET